MTSRATVLDEAVSLLVAAEVAEIRRNHAPIANLAEAVGVIAEEIAEFFDEVRRKRANRNADRMRAELVQIAAVACRAAADLYADLADDPKNDDAFAISDTLALVTERRESEKINSAHEAYGLLIFQHMQLWTVDCPAGEGDRDRLIQIAATASAAIVDLGLAVTT